MGKLIAYTKTTALASNVPRQLAIDLLQSHKEFIELNKLVTSVEPIKAPQDAEPAEYFSNWYEITEHMNMGLGKLKLVFKGCWTDQSWGVLSHTIMPKLFEMRNSYRIGGNQAGEPREPGMNVDGLYLKEDISIDCHVPMIGGFVKKEMQAASQTMIERMKRKAELLDEGKLLAMFEDGKLKTAKAGPASTTEDRPPPPDQAGTTGSPVPMNSPRLQRPDTFQSQQPLAPADSRAFGRYDNARGNQQSARSSYVPPYQQNGYQGPPVSELPGNAGNQSFVNEPPGSYYQAYNPHQQNSMVPQPFQPQQAFRSELPGDMSLQPPPAANSRPSSRPGSSRPSSQGPPQSQSGDRSSLPSNNRSSSGYQVINPDVQINLVPR